MTKTRIVGEACADGNDGMAYHGHLPTLRWILHALTEVPDMEHGDPGVDEPEVNLNKGKKNLVGR
jgi:hypothetical protein